MKTLKFVSAIILLAALISGCDYVTPSKQSVSNTPDTATYIRKVLVEDYTGHQCDNCPPAAVELDTLMILYPNHIIPIAVHAGSNADAVLPYYSTDFKTSVGTTWNTYFGINSNPNGMVNRSGIATYSTWASLVNNYLFASGVAIPASMNIKIANHYDSALRTITDTLTCKYLQATDSAYSLSVVVTEDSVIDHQAFFLPTPHDDPAYVFNHILRGSMNGAWGDTLSKSPQPAMTTFTKIYTLNLSTTKIKADKHCHVVAFIFNSITKEVIQAEEVGVIQ